MNSVIFNLEATTFFTLKLGLPEAFFRDPRPLPRDDEDRSSGLIGSRCLPLLSRPYPPILRLLPPPLTDGTCAINVSIKRVQNTNKQLREFFIVRIVKLVYACYKSFDIAIRA